MTTLRDPQTLIDSRKRKREAPNPTANQKIFNPGGKKSGGVWHGAGHTNTKPSPTLFITNIPSNVPISEVEALFRTADGFFALRTVRHMVFVDFKSIPAASAAMRAHQNHMFPQATNHDGMKIDYDKDPTSKRNAQYERQQFREYKDDSEIVRVMCICGGLVLKLRFPKSNPVRYATLPRRKTDQSIVVDTDAFVCAVVLTRGEIKKLRREAGIETQYRFNCRECKLPVCYSSVPFEKTTKLMYLMPDAITTDLTRWKRRSISAVDLAAAVSSGGAIDDDAEEAEIKDAIAAAATATAASAATAAAATSDATATAASSSSSSLAAAAAAATVAAAVATTSAPAAAADATADSKSADHKSTLPPPADAVVTAAAPAPAAAASDSAAAPAVVFGPAKVDLNVSGDEVYRRRQQLSASLNS